MSDDRRFDTKWSEVPLVCPHCGNRGLPDTGWEIHSRVPFKLIENVVRSFAFGATVVDGTVSIVADVETDSVDWESGTDLRLECMHCFNDFALPPDADIDFQ